MHRCQRAVDATRVNHLCPGVLSGTKILMTVTLELKMISNDI